MLPPYISSQQVILFPHPALLFSIRCQTTRHSNGNICYDRHRSTLLLASNRINQVSIQYLMSTLRYKRTCVFIIITFDASDVYACHRSCWWHHCQTPHWHHLHRMYLNQYSSISIRTENPEPMRLVMKGIRLVLQNILIFGESALELRWFQNRFLTVNCSWEKRKMTTVAFLCPKKETVGRTVGKILAG